jgi:hypothetical protein
MRRFWLLLFFACHQTTARTAVIKAKAAQIETISTLIADVIDGPSSDVDDALWIDSTIGFRRASSVKI